MRLVVGNAGHVAVLDAAGIARLELRAVSKVLVDRGELLSDERTPRVRRSDHGENEVGGDDASPLASELEALEPLVECGRPLVDERPPLVESQRDSKSFLQSS